MNLKLNLDKQSNNGESKSTQQVTGRAAASYHNANLIRGMMSGKVLSGEITAINGNEVEITIEDAKIIMARLEQEIALSLGAKMSFEVRKATGNQVILRPLFANTTQDTAAMKAIQAAGIPVNEKTVAMTSIMMEEGMAIDKKSLQDMFRLVHGNPDTNIRSIVQMADLGIPVTREGVQQFEAYKNNQYQILGQIETMAEDFGKLMKEMTDHGDVKGAADLGREIAKVFTTSIQMPDTKENALPITMPEQSTIQKAPKSEVVVPPAVEGNNLPVEIETAGEKKVLEEGKVLTEEADISQDKKGVRLTEREIRNLTGNLLELGATPEQVEQIKNKSWSSRDILNLISTITQDSTPDFADKIKSLLSGKEYQSLLQDVIGRQWLLTPEAVEDKEKVEQLYKRILEQTGKISEILTNAEKSNSSLMKGNENLKQNVTFMNQLNQLFTYVQLPLKMSNENTHGDLYVYTNKKSLAEKKDSVSALLHLEMEYLGTMDIHITMKEGNHINTHFYLEKEEMLTYIEENIHLLNDRLKNKGYQMDVQTSLKDSSSKGIVEEMLDNEKGSKMVQKYSFDVRA